MIKNGIYREFHDNGRIAFEGKYQNDTIVGFAYCFTESGDTSIYFNHHNGANSFPYKKWLDNGLTLLGDFTDASKKSVTWKWFDKRGKQIKIIIEYAKNKGFAVPN
jgi:antitoxin component YwqK of YwqJK toxin-antitoxin module